MKTLDRKTFSIGLALSTMAFNFPAGQPCYAAGFVSVSPMNNARNFHTATLLTNGNVLVAGGFPMGTRAELYDPETDTWIDTGALRVARAFHTATLLPDGKVLVTAGSQSGALSTSAELYDPATATWGLTASMKRARSGPSAALLPNGKVLIVGGDSANSSELYDPASRTWTLTGSPASFSVGCPPTLLAIGKVLAWGRLYDPVDGTWTTTGASSASYDTACLLFDGKVLAAGNSRTFTADLYDPKTGLWSPTGSLTWDRDFSKATMLRNGRVLITGGYQQETDTPMSTAEEFDPTTRAWTEVPMNEPHFSHTATLLANGKVLIAGGNGWNVDLLASAEVYEPDVDTSTPSITILQNTNQIMSFSWSGVGALEQSHNLTNWQPAPIQDNPHIVITSNSMKFFRIKGD